ncbi:signal transduction histidine kinase/CheY-like chemotaxis protein/HPt (histidine-containing phosphotransfer) domain-containing protein [Lysobacter niabensis]|uniref:histidine kinase n=1 Tax=Agrilutibacter niabensis TaxID=380628 RepID=A0ABU1VRP5_9GAMM|nr:ATP-binding protein [Lysobacter niabensis]MDR7100162.1 signal transduction histidine kinase/CheY-like chemotaxis protein/HPt (histidine-containing phosphotransfer) domain-containing protein [Lysobacter niabensis]
MKAGIRQQLWILFGLFLLTGATVLVVDEVAQYQARQSLLALRGQSLLGLREIKAVSDAYGLEVVDTTFRTRNHLITWEEGEARIDAARVRIDRSWESLAQLPRTPEEATHFRAAEQERVAADAAMVELHGILARKDIDALGSFATTRLYPAIDPVTLRLKLLSDLATVKADRVVRDNLRDNRRVSALRIGLSLAALVVIALIGRTVLRNAYRGVESLAFIAERMRQHDYAAMPPYLPRGSELGMVADAFMEMRRDVLGFETELTEQLARNEKVRAELEQRERFQRSLLDAAQVAIIAMDGEGRWTTFNAFAERMLGWRAEEVVGRVPRHASDASLPDDAPRLMPKATAERIAAEVSQRLGREVDHDWQGMYDLAELRQAPTEARLLHKDGHEVPVLLAVAALHDEHGKRMGLIAVATDLTERHRLEADLRASEARAQEANRAKSSFLAAMSHEIRTPMIGVTGMIEILAHSRLDHDQRHALNVIQQSSQSLLQIIGDILDFSKIEAGRMEIAPSVVNLAAVLRSTVANYTGAASSKGLTLTCEVDERIAPAHLADALRLRQIIGNFLSNAIKFTTRGGVEVALEWRGGVPADDAHPLGADLLSFRVTDTGIGISAEAQQRLFQPFAQAESDTTRRYGGTGLGLAICTRLAELMGGVVTMDSVPQIGTTLRMAITLAHASPANLPAADALPTGQAAAFSPRRLPTLAQAERERSLVLLVDDHPTNRLVITRQLALVGYASEAVEGGAQALARWRTGRYALLLSDVHMPHMDGYALAGNIRREEQQRGLPRTPIIALTASALKGEAERCLAAGMDDYLAKPVPIATLAAMLQRWLPHTASAQADADVAGNGDANASTAPASDGFPQLQEAPPLLDYNALNDLSGGDEAETSAVLRDFLDATAQDLAQLAQAREDGDIPAIARQAHKIKGAARLVGAIELAHAAAELEAAGQAGAWAGILPLVAHVDTAAERLKLLVAERHSAD